MAGGERRKGLGSAIKKLQVFRVEFGCSVSHLLDAIGMALVQMSTSWFGMVDLCNNFSGNRSITSFPSVNR